MADSSFKHNFIDRPPTLRVSNREFKNLRCDLGQSNTSEPGIELLGFDLNETPSDVISRLGYPDGVPMFFPWLADSVTGK